jgi:hypothetical protein
VQPPTRYEARCDLCFSPMANLPAFRRVLGVRTSPDQAMSGLPKST